MTYKEAETYLEHVSKYGSIPGLNTIRELLRRIGNPQAELKFVHIAGTNGKGSTLAFISSILRAAGYRTGCYSSPSVFERRESIRIDGQFIEEEAFAGLMNILKAAADDMTADGFSHPTIFEMETALSFLYFREEGCDIVVAETGLGGLLDATNIIEHTILAVFTPISLDHTAFLGNAIADIAAHKAGIVKKGALAVSAVQLPEAEKAIAAACKAVKTVCVTADAKRACQIRRDGLSYRFSYGELRDIMPGLKGRWQIANSVLAIEAVKLLEKKGFTIKSEHIKQGLRDAVWEGRFSVLDENPLVILDGAHNEAAALRLKETVEECLAGKRLFFIMGVLKDKEYEKIAALMAPLADSIITVTPPGNDRALDGRVLLEAVKKYQPYAVYKPSLEEAARACLEAAGEGDAVIVFGSLSYLGEFKKVYKR